MTARPRKMPQVHHQAAPECNRSSATCQDQELRCGASSGEFLKAHLLTNALPRRLNDLLYTGLEAAGRSETSARPWAIIGWAGKYRVLFTWRIQLIMFRKIDGQLRLRSRKLKIAREH